MAYLTFRAFVPRMVACGRLENQTNAVANVLSPAYTVGADDVTLEATCNVNLKVAPGSNFTVVLSYTDENGAAQATTLRFAQNDGSLHTSITNGTGTGPYMGTLCTIRCKAGTAVTVATVGSFGTYNVEAHLMQIM